MAKNQQAVEEFAALCELKDGVLHSPVVYSKSKSGKVTAWQIFVGLSDESPITEELIKRGPLKPGVFGIYWTEFGFLDGERQTSEITTVQSGKNQGKANATTPLTQAILDARSEYNKKIRKGGTTDPEQLYEGEVSIEELIKAGRWRVFPMALHSVAKHWKRVHYPAYVQPKYDGVLFVVVSHPDLPGRGIDAYSRGREFYEGQEHILAELAGPLARRPGLYVVGELYKEGLPLQEISGRARRQGPREEGETLLDYYIFDAFYLRREGFEQRLAHLRDLEQDLINAGAIYVKIAPTSKVDDRAALDQYYYAYLAEGYEGIVIRNADSPYEYGLQREIRSLHTLKMKPRPDAEFPVVGFKDGVGKEKGAVIWICAENDEGVKARAGELLPLEERLTFAVTPNMSYERRQLIYSRLCEDPALFEKIRGRGFTVEYFRLSKDQLPQQPKGKGFRDPEINALLLDL